MNRVGFTLPDVGLREIRGLVYVDEGFLVIKLKDALMGEFDIDEHTVKIEPTALTDVRIERGLLRDRLVLEPKRMDLLDVIPGEHRNALELRVWRRYRNDLKRLVDEYRAMR